MTLQTSAQSTGAARLVADLVACFERVWRDPGFQAVLRKETRRYVVTVVAEARAAAKR